MSGARFGIVTAAKVFSAGAAAFIIGITAVCNARPCDQKKKKLGPEIHGRLGLLRVDVVQVNRPNNLVVEMGILVLERDLQNMASTVPRRLSSSTTSMGCSASTFCPAQRSRLVQASSFVQGRPS